jgi:hypothetical protein
MSTSFTWRPVLLAAALAVSIVQAAGAQDIATSFEQLHGLVKPGDVVTVIDNSGSVVKGSIVDISPATLKLRVAGRNIQKLQFPGRQVQLSSGDVHAISQDRHLDMGKGAAWGFAFGAGLGAVSAVPGWYGGCRGCGSSVASAALVTGALGAIFGAAFAEAKVTTHVLFVNSASRTKVTFGPLLECGQRGAWASLRF